jgi:hypothetical protein
VENAAVLLETEGEEVGSVFVVRLGTEGTNSCCEAS